MSRTHYQIYKEQTFVLAKTLIVKHDEIASSMNEELYNRGYIVDSNPYNWRYYLNLSGEYHDADKDELYELYGTEYMMVKLPSDNGPIEVALTKDLLHGTNADKSLTNEYQIGSKFYSELVSRYPNFETLIIGILNPIDRAVSLSAANGEILFIAGRYKKISGSRRWFDTTWYSINEVLIEPQEDNLIFELQKYIDNFLRHWNNPDYVVGNDLYAVTMLGILYCNIPIAILNIRLGNCKTVKAHTFHIREYLESHGQIGRYVDFMPIGSALWLYRNANYLEANAGKQLTFNSIMNNMLTPNEIPMSAYSVRHELSNLSDDKLLPTGMLYKEILNFEVVGASDDDRTVRNILDDQIGLARDNHLNLDDTTDKIQDTINWGGDDRINTKVLESEMLELGEPYPFTLDQFLFNVWGYSALRGYYTGTAYATNPLTGDRLSFNAKNAYIMAQYCMNKAIAGVTLERIPAPTLYHIPKTNQPENLPDNPMFQLKPNIDRLMGWCVADKTRRLKVLEVVGTSIPNFHAQDSEEFFRNVQDIYFERIRRYDTYCDVENVEERGDLELIAKRLYWTGFKQQSVDMNYDDWFRTVGFDPDQFNNEDLLSIGLELIASSTGTSDKDTISKRWLQKSLLAIMKHFISYTVHVIEKFADGEVSYLEGQTLRYSNFTWNYIAPLPVKYNLALSYTVRADVKHAMRIDISNMFENTTVDIKSKMKTTLDVGGFEYGQSKHRLNVGTYSLSGTISNVEMNTEKAEPVYIVVIDNIVNVLMMSNIHAKIRDVSWSLVMPKTSFGIVTPNIHGKSVDTFVSLFGYDTGGHSAVVDGVFADITDAKQNTNPKIDTVGVKTIGISGGLSDAALEPFGFTDSLALTNLNTSGNIDDNTDYYDRNVDDKGGLDVGALSASINDSSLVIDATFDNASIVLSDLSLMLTDPQIDGVFASPDVLTNTILNITGRSDDVLVDMYATSDSAMVLYGIDIGIAEDEVTLDYGVDVFSTSIGSITANMVDVDDITSTLDNNALVVSNIDVNTRDENTQTSTVDTDKVHVTDITVSVLDDATAIGTSDDNVDVINVTANIVDDNASGTSDIDNDALTITNINLSSTDTTDGTTVHDVDNVSIGSVSLSTSDDNARSKAMDDTAVTIGDINVILHDEIDKRNGDSDIGMTLGSISGRIENTAEEINFDTDTAAILHAGLISINLNDIEVDLNFSSNHKVGVDDTEISVTISDSEIHSLSPADNHGIAINSEVVEVQINDDNESYVMSHDSHGAIIESSIITGEMRDDVIVTDVADVNTLSTRNVTMTSSDDVQKIQTVDSSVTSISANEMTATQVDSDVVAKHTDPTSAVTIKNIQINIKDESNDSNSQP